MSELKMLKIQNYQKMLNGAHPLYTCLRAEERSTHYMFDVNDDAEGLIYTFKLAKKGEKDGSGWILTILWGNDIEYTILKKDDIKSFRNLYSLMCEMINQVKAQTNPPF